MKVSELDYPLPPERIAQEPLAERDAARLLVLHLESGRIEHRIVRDLPRLLDCGDLLVRNVTRVIPARLRGRRASGGRVELLLVTEQSSDCWTALARPMARLRRGERIRLDSGLEVELEPCPSGEPGLVLARAPALGDEASRSGLLPLPPYIRRTPTPQDRSRYQTVYASRPGSVAAPTAGLHFTPALLDALAASGVTVADVTLHIGPGTFAPVRHEELAHHPMHPERFHVPEETVRLVAETRRQGGRILAVGTSALRALEAAAESGELRAGAGETRLFVLPGFAFRTTTALLTNFHQPRTTLLALVAAFAGTSRMRAAYAEGLAAGYRFLSYGDAMLLL